MCSFHIPSFNICFLFVRLKPTTNELQALTQNIKQVVDFAMAESASVCMYPKLVNAFQAIGVTQPQDLSSLFPSATVPTPVSAPLANAVFSAPAMNSAPMANLAPMSMYARSRVRSSQAMVNPVPSMDTNLGVASSMQLSAAAGAPAPMPMRNFPSSMRPASGAPSSAPMNSVPSTRAQPLRSQSMGAPTMPGFAAFPAMTSSAPQMGPQSQTMGSFSAFTPMTNSVPSISAGYGAPSSLPPVIPAVGASVPVPLTMSTVGGKSTMGGITSNIPMTVFPQFRASP